MDAYGSEIVILRKRDDDYISLTDMARYKNPEATGVVISHWLSTRFAIDFLGIFEQLNNPDFNITEFSNIRNQAGSNGFVLTVKQWVERTNAIGITSAAGRDRLDFMRDEDRATVKPIYDLSCEFMYQECSDIEERRKLFFDNFNIDKEDF